MRIVPGYPPNIDAIREVFDLSDKKPVFAYGHLLYNPHDLPLESHIMAHEEVHERQQVAYGGVETWWRRYLTDTAFRLAQEVEAYREQYRFVKGIIKDRNRVANFLHLIATDLSSPMYGGMTTYRKAHRLITQ